MCEISKYSFIYIYISVVSSTFCETVVHDHDDDDDVEISISSVWNILFHINVDMCTAVVQLRKNL